MTMRMRACMRARIAHGRAHALLAHEAAAVACSPLGCSRKVSGHSVRTPSCISELIRARTAAGSARNTAGCGGTPVSPRAYLCPASTLRAYSRGLLNCCSDSSQPMPLSCTSGAALLLLVLVALRRRESSSRRTGLGPCSCLRRQHALATATVASSAARSHSTSCRGAACGTTRVRDWSGWRRCGRASVAHGRARPCILMASKAVRLRGVGRVWQSKWLGRLQEDSYVLGVCATAAWLRLGKPTRHDGPTWLAASLPLRRDARCRLTDDFQSCWSI